MEDEIVIVKTKPTIKNIGIYFFGTIFFCAFAYRCSPICSFEWRIQAETEREIMIVYVLCGVFLFFAFCCLWEFLRVKIIVLTNKRLIIKRPLLFLTKNIPISNIQDISQTPYKINVSSSRVGNFNVFEGKKMYIKLKKGRTVKLNSFEISDYYTLIKHLDLLLKDKNALLRKKQKKSLDCENPIREKYQGYGWLLFLAIMTLGLLYALIRGK